MLVSGVSQFYTVPVFLFLWFMGLRLYTGIWFVRFVNYRTSGFYDSQFCELWNCVSGSLRNTVPLSFLHCGFRGFAVPTILVSCVLGFWSLYVCRGQCLIANLWMFSYVCADCFWSSGVHSWTHECFNFGKPEIYVL